jgi:iron complex outermembrane recepter protein
MKAPRKAMVTAANGSYVLAALALCAANQAVAQVAGDATATPPLDSAAEGSSDQNDGEIVVTALKRSASAQNVPATIALITGETIVKANISSGLELSKVAPGVIVQAGPGVSPVAAIRGIGTSASNFAFDQSVALFVDGVFLARGRDYSASIFDVGDIQVIKGSQSAILGKNTTVGAIALTTHRPEDKFGYLLSYNHDLTLGSDTVDAMLNLPLSPTLAVRLSGRYADLEGWKHNELLNEDTSMVRTRAGRISLRWQPSNDLDWNVNYQHETFRSTGQGFYIGGDKNGLVAAYAAAAGDPNFISGFNDRFRSSPRPGFPNDYARNKSDRVISNLTYSFGEGYSLTSTTAYVRSRGSYLFNNNAVANSPVYFSSDLNGSNTVSQEVRVATPRIGMFDLVAGALYYHDVYRYNLGIDALAPSPIVGAMNSKYKQTTEAWSGFAALNGYLTDSLTVSGAIRYTHETRRADYVRDIIRPGNLTSLIYQPFAPTSLERGRGYFDWSGSIQYEIAPRVMVYSSYGKGSKSLGFAQAPNNPLALRPNGTRAAEIDPESAKTFEAGIKIGSGGGSHLNVAFFNITIDNYQTSLFSGTEFIVKNIDIRSRGAELEATLRATDNLRFSLNLTYADTLNKDHLPTERDVLVRAPKWSGIASVNYETELNDKLRLEVDASSQFRSSFYFQDTLASNVPQAAGVAKIDLRAALTHKPSGIEVAIIGQNLTNRRVPDYGAGLFPGVAGAYLVSTEPPRRVSLQLTLRK